MNWSDSQLVLPLSKKSGRFFANSMQFFHYSQKMTKFYLHKTVLSLVKMSKKYFTFSHPTLIGPFEQLISKKIILIASLSSVYPSPRVLHTSGLICSIKF